VHPHPPAGPAMDVPATAEGWRTRRRKGWLWIATIWAAVALLTTMGWTVGADSPRAGRLQAMPAALLILLPVQAVTRACGRRERRILQTYVWQAYPCETDGIHVRLQTDAGRVDALTPRMLKRKPSVSSSDHPEVAWFCGDLRYGGVVSPVGGDKPMRYVREKRPTKKVQRREPFAGADQLAHDTGVVGTVY
jgi:hypothetical protein